MILTVLKSVGDSLLRVIFLFFIDIMVAGRLSSIYHYTKLSLSWMLSTCSECTPIESVYIRAIIASGFIISALALVLYPKGIVVTGYLVLSTILACFATINYAILLQTISSSVDVARSFTPILLSRHFCSGIVLSLLAFLFVLFRLPSKPSLTRCIVSLISFIMSYLLLLIPVFACQSQYFRHLLTFKSNPIITGPNGRTPALCGSLLPGWKGHVYSFLPHSNHVLATQATCKLSTLTDQTKFDSVLTSLVQFLWVVLPYTFGFLNLAYLSDWLKLTETIHYIGASFAEQIQFYRNLGLFEFISEHWERLNALQILTFHFMLKVSLVLAIGPSMWPIDRIDQVNSTSDSLNISLIINYISPSPNQTTLETLLSRIYVGCFVQGSETWISVFGFAAFFTGLASILVSLLLFFLDPWGQGTSELANAVMEEPVDIHAWNAIEDPALALQQNNMIAVALLGTTRWNCAIVFLFLAFQYDLPSLPLAQRICCSVYGVIVVAIACIPPLQALVKSLLLRLRIPGRDSPWSAHLRLLCFCTILIVIAFCIITFVPELVVDRLIVHKNQTTANSSFLNPLPGSSADTLRARQLRIFLNGCQFLLGLFVTLIEYTIYQIALRNPNWNGFRTSLFWTKLISSVIDYSISVLSFLAICWLTFFDCMGICRLSVICCYFYYVLFPSTQRAYTWIRWRLLFNKRMKSLQNPTEKQLQSLDDMCPICYSEMTTENSKVTLCGHLYHTECLIQWLQRQNFCPLCHADLLSERVTPSRRMASDQD